MWAVSLCFWCWCYSVRIIAICNTCNHWNPFEDAASAGRWCETEFSIQVQSRNIIQEWKKNGTYLCTPFSTPKITPWLFEGGERHRVNEIEAERVSTTGEKKRMLQSFRALLSTDFYYIQTIFAIRCQCHISTAWIVCLVSVAHTLLNSKNACKSATHTHTPY